MKRIHYNGLAAMGVAVVALTLSVAFAHAGDGRTCPGSTPNPSYASIGVRDFNDCPTSTLTITNNYPSLITVHDDTLDCFGFANRHTWSFSNDGTTDAQFENCSAFRFCADVTLSGSGGGEGGLRLSPWWTAHNDGQFMLNANTGEVACFGGRLPFYSFTVNNGVHYVKGTTAHMEIVYFPHSLSSADPATITYNLTYASVSYSSGPLPFDQGNATEDPPHGLWGELVPAYAGGYVQCNLGQGSVVDFAGSWANICFENDEATPTHHSTWGQLKTQYR